MSRERNGPDDLKPLRIVGYSLDDAAQALGISRRTLRRRRESGAIKAIFVEKCALIEPGELQRLIDSGGVRQRAPGAGGAPRRSAPRP